MADEEFKIIGFKKVWAVYTNTDLTEGKGRQYIKTLCDFKATAERLGKKEYVQGTDCPIGEITVFKIHEGGEWYAPVPITAPTQEDKERQAEIERYERAYQDARAAGLTPDQIKAIQQGPGQ